MRFGLVSDPSPASRRFPRKSGFVLPPSQASFGMRSTSYPYQPLVEVVELEWQCPKLLA